jgi:IS5 family transposase
MEHQPSFAQAEHAGKKKQARRERFLAEMERVVPWTRLVALIEPFYPEGKRGRPPMGVERMLRIYFLQQWYALADEALEDSLYDIQALRAFARINLGSEAVPDATTLLKFRHLLERHDLTKAILDEINAVFTERGLLLREGTIVDATIIHAPSSTKNQSKTRDPEMHQTKKGNAWHFGMKAHVGVDQASGLVHTITGTAANVADVAQVHAVLHGQEKTAQADAGYQGVEKRPEIIARFGHVRWQVAAKRGRIKAMAAGPRKDLTQALEKAKSAVARLCGASLPHRQKPLRPSQGALPRFGQEHGATPDALRLGQSGDRQIMAAGSSLRNKTDENGRRLHNASSKKPCHGIRGEASRPVAASTRRKTPSNFMVSLTPSRVASCSSLP